MDDWYFQNMYYDAQQGLNCCSDLPIEFHWLKNVKSIYLLEFFFYHFSVFGLNKNSQDTLPPKLLFEKVLEIGQIQSNQTGWKKFDFSHNIADDEHY